MSFEWRKECVFMLWGFKKIIAWNLVWRNTQAVRGKVSINVYNLIFSDGTRNSFPYMRNFLHMRPTIKLPTTVYQYQN